MREKYTKYSADDPIKVLLVDDENEYRDAISRRLIKRGINPEHAACGEMCLEYLKNNRVDVIVMDVKMPGMSGIETLKKVKSLYPESEVILLTGQAAVSDGVEGIKSGAFDYLTKPVEMDHLLVKITQAYEKIKLQMEKEKEKKLRVRFERQMLDTERLVSLGRLSTGVAHEINNPLAIINEAAGLMQMILNKNEMRNIPQLKELKTANEKIENAVVRARKITHQLLGFAGKQVTEISETNLNLLIDETLDLLEKALKDKGAHVKKKYGNNLFFIWSDPYQIRQVFINLLTNAVYEIDHGGVIEINMIQAEGNFVNIEIRDNGKGIPKENIGKIFDPFFTTKPSGKGTGLGLFVVQRIVTGLNAQIEVGSKYGKGTTFTLKFPKYMESADAVTRKKNVFSKVLSKIKE